MHSILGVIWLENTRKDMPNNFEQGKVITTQIDGTPVKMIFAAVPNKDISHKIKTILLNSYSGKL